MTTYNETINVLQTSIITQLCSRHHHHHHQQQQQQQQQQLEEDNQLNEHGPSKRRNLGPEPKFTDDLRTIVRQFSELRQSYDNGRIHKTLMTIVIPLLRQNTTNTF